MGGSGSSLIDGGYITAQSIRDEVESKRLTLSCEDKRLLEYTITTIPTLSNLSDCEVFIEFRSTNRVSVTTNKNPTERLVFAFINDKPAYQWEKKGRGRACVHFVTNGIAALASGIGDIFRNAAGHVFANAIGKGMKKALKF